MAGSMACRATTKPALVLALLGGAVLLLMPSLAVAQEDWCREGCPVREYDPVCGANGVTYQSKCLAVCQGVEPAYGGACREGGEALIAREPETRAEVFRLEDMAKYRDQGFLLVGFGRVDRAFVPKQPLVRFTPEGMPFDQLPSEKPEPSHAVKFDLASGLVYVSIAPLDLLPPGPCDEAIGEGSLKEGGSEWGAVKPGRRAASRLRRMLWVTGADNRIQAPDTTVFPWCSVGQVDIAGSDGKSYIGSGSLITHNAVLTAGHVVHGGKGGSWAAGWGFAPGRNGASNPYGVMGWSSVTTYTKWAVNGDLAYDMAVIKLASSVAADHGTFTLRASDSFGPVQLWVSGYPGDKPGGTQWYDGCTVSDSNPNDMVTEYTGCDVMGGQSGGPVWEHYVTYWGEDKRGVRGIVSYGTCSCCDGSCSACCSNYRDFFQTMTSTRVKDAKAWAA